MNSILKPGLTITKVLIWNNIENSAGIQCTECRLHFSDGSHIHYECNPIVELRNKHTGIYEHLGDDTYHQVEDWE